MLSYAVICFHMLSYAVICFHTLSYAFMCFYLLLHALICSQSSKLSPPKTAGLVFTGFYPRKPVKNPELDMTVTRLFTKLDSKSIRTCDPCGIRSFSPSSLMSSSDPPESFSCTGYHVLSGVITCSFF